MCENSFSHMSIAAILVRGHPYISLPIGNDNLVHVAVPASFLFFFSFYKKGYICK